jgi:hypothetical protein
LSKQSNLEDEILLRGVEFVTPKNSKL